MLSDVFETLDFFMIMVLEKQLKKREKITLREFKCDECGHVFWTEDRLVSLYCPKCGQTVYYTEDLVVFAKQGKK